MQEQGCYQFDRGIGQQQLGLSTDCSGCTTNLQAMGKFRAFYGICINFCKTCKDPKDKQDQFVSGSVCTGQDQQLTNFIKQLKRSMGYRTNS